MAKENYTELVAQRKALMAQLAEVVRELKEVDRRLESVEQAIEPAGSGVRIGPESFVTSFAQTAGTPVKGSSAVDFVWDFKPIQIKGGPCRDWVLMWPEVAEKRSRGIGKEIEKRAVAVLKSLNRPVTTRELLGALEESGLSVPGQRPASNLAAHLLQHRERFQATSDGWILLPKKNKEEP